MKTNKKNRPLILHLTSTQMLPGGCQRFMCDLAKHFSQWADVAIMHNQQGDKPNFWDKFDPRIKFYPVYSKQQGIELIQDMQPDFVHHHQPGCDWFENETAHIPRVGTCHGYDSNINPPKWVKPIAVKNYILHGIDLDRFKQKEHEPVDVLKVGILSRWDWIKLPIHFIQELERRKDLQNIEFHFIGKGGYPPQDHVRRMEKLFAEYPGPAKLVKHGDVAPEAVPELLQSMDVYLLPSTTESASYSTMEAMATGLPVVARNVGALPVVVKDCGILCDSDAGLFEAVKYFRNLQHRKEYGYKARCRALVKFDVNRMLAEYELEYRKRTDGLIRPENTDLQCSVCIPVFDTEPKWITECVQSVASQTGVDFEVILVNDGSTRYETTQRLRELHQWLMFDKGILCQLIELPVNSGVGHALNEAIRAARTPLIARVDADDTMHPTNRLATQYRLMQEHPEIAVIGGQMNVMDKQGRTIMTTNQRFDEDTFIGKQPHCLNHPTVMMRRYPVLASGGYLPSGASQDFDLWCRLQLKGYKMRVFDYRWCNYRTHDGQETKQGQSVKRRAEMEQRYNPMADRLFSM